MSRNNSNIDGICILSFDNGGPGTYSQLLILKEYMSRMASDLQVSEENVYPADHFDMMGGVGLGGLIAVMLGLLRMNVNEAIDGLLEITSTIFQGDSQDTINVEANSMRLKEGIESILHARSIPLATKMNEETCAFTKCKVALYAATSANLSHPHIFRTYPSRGSSLNPTIVEAICATMAISTYFSPVKIGPPRRQKSFVGGALGANNPTRLLFDEASVVYGKYRRITRIFSLGCGLPRVLSAGSSSEADVHKLLRDVATDCETVAHDLSTRLFSIDAYVRLDVDRGMEEVTMEDWNELGAIESHTEVYIANIGVSKALESSLRCMKERIASTTLGQLNHSSSIKTKAKQAPLVSPYFIARRKPWEIMVHHLTSLSSEQKIFPITGMGGCGKTQLVSYFLKQHPRLYNHVVYVDASSSSSIKSDLQTWARTLGDDHGRDEWEDALRALNSPLEDGRWALILDNADDPGVNLVPFLPNNSDVTIFITSRNRDLGRLSTTYHLELGEMSSEEALKVLLKAALRQLPLSDEEMESAQSVIKELGGLAVALVQAGTYCYRLSSTVGDSFRPYTFTQYLSLFASHRAELMKKAEPTSLDSYERGAYTTLDLSYKELPQAPKGFLRLISFFHHTDIPLEAFATAANNDFEDSWYFSPRPDYHKDTILELNRTLCNGKEWNELWVQEIIQTLHSFSLLTTTSINNSVFLNLHPLIQKWCRDMDPSGSMHFKAMAAQVLASSASDDDIRLNRNILPHILDMLSHTKLQGMHVNDLMTFGIILKNRGHYQNAAQLVHHALEAIEGSEGSESKTTLGIYFWLGAIYMDVGKWDEAERLLETLLQKGRRILGTGHQYTIITAGNLAATYQYRGRYGDAEILGVEVLEQKRRIMGMEHPETITSAGNLALTYYYQGRYEEAEKLGVEVLEQRRRILGMKHPDTFKAAGNLAMTYCSQGRYREAEKLEVEALEQKKRIMGMEHPETIASAGNLTPIYYYQGRYEEAEKLGVEVLEQRRRILGMDHPDTFKAAGNLAMTYCSQGRYWEAEKLEVELLEQKRRIMGMEHPETITSAGNLALTYYYQGRYEEAERLGVEVLEQRRRILGMDHPDTFKAAGNLALTYRSQGRYWEAEKLGVEVLKQERQILGLEHPDTIMAAANLGGTYHAQSKWKEAEELAVEVLEQQTRILGPEHPHTIIAMANLAATYGEQDRWVEDAFLLAPAVQLGLKVLGREHPDTQIWIEQLVDVYNKLGKEKEAEGMKGLLL